MPDTAPIQGDTDEQAEVSPPPLIESVTKDEKIARLVGLVEETELWHTAMSEPYATIRVGDHSENLRVQSDAFRRWLNYRYYREFGGAPGNSTTNEAVSFAVAKAQFDGECHEVSLRVGGHDGNVYLDLGQPDWSAVKVTGDGWEIEAQPANYFRRSPGMEALPIPVNGGSVQDLRRFVNLETDDHFVLIVAFLIGALIPSGPYPILVLNGEQGSGKSTLARLLRQLIDPNRANTRQPPCNDDALLVAAENGWLLNFDNLSNISPRLSEALCRISTGAGFGRRRFYTNTDEVIVNVSRPVIINGIPELAVHADLADRALFIQLPPMSSEIRRPESEYWADFNSAAPGIFGALLKGVSAALRNQGQVRLDGLPRMADFARRVVAALPAVGLEPDQFVAAYESNRDQASVALAETDPVAIAITRIVDDGGGSWDGTSADLLQDFDHLLSDAPIFRVLPKSPSAIGIAVRRLAQVLPSIGIGVRLYREGHRGTRKVEFTKAA